MVERRGLAYALHASIDTFADAGLHVIDGACAPGKASRTLAEILNVLGRLGEEQVAEEELRRAQRRHRIQLEFSLDSAAGPRRLVAPARSSPVRSASRTAAGGSRR